MPLPTVWLMTDERQGDALWRALAGLPRGSGVVFRHHATGEPERTAIFVKVALIARRRGLVFGWEERAPLAVVMAGGGRIARVHSVREARQASGGTGAVAVFVSPVFATRSHAGAPALGLLRAAMIARAAPLPAIALGGMTPNLAGRARKLGFHGWAAIDGLTPGRQKRKAVPR